MKANQWKSRKEKNKIYIRHHPQITCEVPNVQSCSIEYALSSVCVCVSCVCVSRAKQNLYGAGDDPNGTPVPRRRGRREVNGRQRKIRVLTVTARRHV